MSIDQLVDSFKGDERSKQELKDAYAKGRKLGFTVFFLLLIIFIPFGFYEAFTWPFGLLDKILEFLSAALIIPTIIGSFIGIFSVQFFARHIKITLPEALKPTIEIDDRKK